MLWNSDFQITLVFHAAELSTNSIRDFVVLWNSDFQTVFRTAELSNIPWWIV